MHRVQSESDLSKVDQNRALDIANQTMQTTDLLARVFTALGNIKVADDEAQSIAAMSGGIHGFSDLEILASEKHDSRWSIPFSDTSFSVPPPKARGRAASDFHGPVSNHLEIGSSHDWTWSGNNQQIEEFMRLRKLNKKKSPDLYRAALTLPKSVSSVTVNIDDGISHSADSSSPVNSPSLFDRLNPFKKRDDFRKMSVASDRLDIKNYLDQTSAGRRSRLSVAAYPTVAPIAKRRISTYSAFSVPDEGSADVLENTTIADLIRALEVMHTQAVTGDGLSIENFLAESRSRLGSTSKSQNSAFNGSFQPPLPSINVLPPMTPNNSRLRRNSLRPLSISNTPLFNRANRRQSAIVDLPSTRRSSLLVPPSNGPPPYSENASYKSHRRFSVRPTLLSIPPGQSPMPSIQATSSLQRRLSMRPSPLLTDNSNLTIKPNRFGRSISASSSNYSSSPLETSPVPNRNSLLTPVNETQLNVPHRQSSRPQLFNPNVNIERKRSDSK